MLIAFDHYPGLIVHNASGSYLYDENKLLVADS